MDDRQPASERRGQSLHPLHGLLVPLHAGLQLRNAPRLAKAHISNFLNKKRSLSLEGLDRVLAAQDLTVDQLLPIDLSAASSVLAGDPMEIVPVVSYSAAMDNAFATAACIIETIQVSASRLQGNRAQPLAKRIQWQRFVAIRADRQQADAMEPLLYAGTIAVLDRHYNSLAPYRSHQPTLFAVRYGAALLLRFVDFDEDRLILRPYSRAFPIQLLTIGVEEAPADYIVGRVCILLSEL